MKNKRKVFVCGDIHGDIEKIKYFKKTNEISENDVLFCAGDAGFIFYDEKNTSYFEKQKEERIEILKNINFKIIVVLGNHENFEYIRKLPTTTVFGGLCNYEPDIPNVYYANFGEVFKIDGINYWTFGGGLSIDKEYRLQIEKATRFKYWWKEEMPTNEEMENGLNNLENKKIDYIITHDAPSSVYSKLKNILKLTDKTCMLQEYLEKVANKTEFKHWFLGHYHPKFILNVFEKYSVLPIGWIEQI